MVRTLFVCLTFLLVLNQIESDWLNCAHITECNCKWSSGKKTASCVSSGLKTLPKLSADIQVLDLHGNPLKRLEEEAFAQIDLINLQRLNLSSTNLLYLHPNAFRELRILIELDLSQNHLLNLSPNTFMGAERLRLLILNDNPLTVLVAEQFPLLRSLKKLEISRCKIQTVHPFAFVNLQALETVNIHQNLLTFLHQNTFNLPVLKTLTLSDNPWYCDCRLREFHDWFLNSNLGNEDLICNGPDRMKHLSWRILKRDDFVCLPSASTSPTVIRTEEGADISFGCFVRGNPKPSVTWSFQQSDININKYNHSDIFISEYQIDNFDEYNDDYLNKSAQWVNVTINNVTSNLSGEWKCSAKSLVGEASAYLTLYLPKARTATARVAPNYSALFLVGGSLLAMTTAGFFATCICWKTKRRVPSSKSFTDQEKKLLDTSLAVSYDRTSGDLGSSYGFETLDRSISMDSEDARCLEPLQITIEGPSGNFPPPPAEFALPAPYGNIFISVQVASRRDSEYPDLLGGGATLPRRSRTCLLKSSYDNMGPRITAAGSSTWSLPGDNVDNTKYIRNPLNGPLSTFSTEFTAL